jgi:hypothetical protein
MEKIKRDDEAKKKQKNRIVEKVILVARAEFEITEGGEPKKSNIEHF